LALCNLTFWIFITRHLVPAPRNHVIAPCGMITRDLRLIQLLDSSPTSLYEVFSQGDPTWHHHGLLSPLIPFPFPLRSPTSMRSEIIGSFHIVRSYEPGPHGFIFSKNPFKLPQWGLFPLRNSMLPLFGASHSHSLVKLWWLRAREIRRRVTISHTLDLVSLWIFFEVFRIYGRDCMNTHHVL